MEVILLLASFILTVQGARLPFIVGGRISDLGAHPWQGSLTGLSSNHICGCVLVSRMHVLTAAHCLTGPEDSYRVQLGLWDRRTRNFGDPREYRLVDYVRHPNYVRDSRQGYPYDISVVTITPADTISAYISEIPMATAEEDGGPDYAGSRCVITGWGRYGGDEGYPNFLQEADVDVLSNRECIEYWGERRIGGYHICVGDKENGETGACMGDSGGPLVCEDRGVRRVVGITSWGASGCETEVPSVYTRVSNLRLWIDEQIG